MSEIIRRMKQKRKLKDTKVGYPNCGNVVCMTCDSMTYGPLDRPVQCYECGQKGK